MNFKKIAFLNKEKREMDYFRGIYKKRFQSEIESYKDSEDENKRDPIQAKDILIPDRISN